MLGMSKPARGVRARTLATFRSEKACAVSVYAELVAGHQIGDCGAALPRYLDDDRGAIALAGAQIAMSRMSVPMSVPVIMLSVASSDTCA